MKPVASRRKRGSDLKVKWLCLLLAFDSLSCLGFERTRSGLQVFYDFRDPQANTIVDRSDAGEPVNLMVQDPEAVEWTDGQLTILRETLIQSTSPASQLIEAVRLTGELTIEAWIQPKSADQKGPARIVSLSRNGSERNFTLGQEGGQYDVRLRTSTTSANGIPSINSPESSLSTKLTHVVYTRDRTGRARIYLDGKSAKEEMTVGDTFPWHDSFHLVLANEKTKDRPWLGTFHMLAIYNRDLLPLEVLRHYQAGADATVNGARASTDTAEVKSSNHPQHAKLFESSIAPILVNHCLECHDSATKKGGLDLSRRELALKGSTSGVVIVPGNVKESYLLETIANDEMPEKRAPLTPEEKKLLRDWIADGAEWTIDPIDPILFTYKGSVKENWLRRLTVPEYIATIRHGLNVDIATEAREILPSDLRADGFSNTAYNLSIDLKHVNAYAQLADIIVSRMDVAAFAKRFSKSDKLTDTNMRPLVAEMGKWILRGPLDDHEIAVYRGISTTVAGAGGSFEEAVGLIVEAMIQSPRFLYLVENQRGDGTRWPIGDYELASRLSYILWGAPPDQALMKAVDSGSFYDRSGVESQVDRMLADPKAIERSLRFIREWLNLDGLDNLNPNREKFPDWNPELARDMREETLAFFKEIVWTQQRPMSDLLNAKVTFVSARLASHYGLPVRSEDGSAYDLKDTPGRGGLLTQGSVLTKGGDEASMVTRGLFVLNNLLRGTVKDPPPCVDTTPVPTKPGLTQRGIAEARLQNSSCGGCHSKFEPLAFGLERFDGLGTFHETDEHGNPLRQDGEILIPGATEPVSYQTSNELMNLLANNERVKESMTWKIAQFALGRPLLAEDAVTIQEVHAVSQANGGTYPSLLKALVLSDLVQTTATERVAQQ